MLRPIIQIVETIALDYVLVVAVLAQVDAADVQVLAQVLVLDALVPVLDVLVLAQVLVLDVLVLVLVLALDVLDVQVTVVDVLGALVDAKDAEAVAPAAAVAVAEIALEIVGHLAAPMVVLLVKEGAEEDAGQFVLVVPKANIKRKVF